jgi:hypothetical protein
VEDELFEDELLEDESFEVEMQSVLVPLYLIDEVRVRIGGDCEEEILENALCYVMEVEDLRRMAEELGHVAPSDDEIQAWLESCPITPAPFSFTPGMPPRPN